MTLDLIYKIAFITFFFSFGVQGFFFIYWKFWEPKFINKYNHVFSYISGMIGDGILVPIINIFAVITLFDVEANLMIVDLWTLSFILGFLVTLVLHYGQKRFNLKNWTMPTGGKWNLLGAYHAFFMFFESSFLVYTFITFCKSLVFYGFSYATTSPFKYVVFIMFLFFITFVFDYRHTLFTRAYVKRAYVVAKNYLFSSD